MTARPSALDTAPVSEAAALATARALARAEWQPVLFGRASRADLAALAPDWPCETVRVRVHRNHGFEPVASAAPAFAAWNGLSFDFAIGGYDDSLALEGAGDADAEIAWIDTARLAALGDGLAAWLVARLRALRAATRAPVLVLAWPLDAPVRDAIAQARIPALHVADLAPIARALGDGWIDRRAEALSGTRLSNRACVAVARELACRWLPAAVRPPTKAIAVDLDGTLYRGVLGEDGVDGVTVEPGHRALQTRLREWKEEGAFLALVSRNELEDVRELFARRADFALGLDDFSAVEVSWGDKADALARIATRLRIGADAIVFVDDNPGELAAVASRLPVVTVHARADGAETAEALGHVAGLFRWMRSAEDALRADDLRASAERDALAAGAASPEDYLRSLGVKLVFSAGDGSTLPRVAELVRKTNQFNLSLARLGEADIAARLAQRPGNVVAVRLTDRLSDSGVVAALVGTREGDTLRVEEVCVSCRALGRRIEDTMLTRALTLMAGGEPPARVALNVAKGPRNGPARHWLAAYAARPLADDDREVVLDYADVAARPLSTAIAMEVLS